jgi:hypothetical protein
MKYPTPADSNSTHEATPAPSGISRYLLLSSEIYAWQFIAPPVEYLPLEYRLQDSGVSLHQK